MTFKHEKFEDSSTMRSLVKVAQEKGWITKESLQKTAAESMVDLIPSTNLMDNILKLCAGLRAQGFNKYADELEVNFLNYKRAQTLYETSPEKGEDLIQAAHPKGSHRLEDVAGDEAVIETILDKHLKIVQMIDKKPTGKLSNAAAIKSVKRVLAQMAGTIPATTENPEASSSEKLENKINGCMNLILVRLNRIHTLTKEELTVDISSKIERIQELAKNPTLDNLDLLKREISLLHSRLDPSSWVHYLSFGATGLSQDSWEGIQGLLGDINKALSLAISARTKLRQFQSNQEVAPAPTAIANPLIENGNTLINKLNSFKSVPSISKVPAAVQWITDEVAEIQDVMRRGATTEMAEKENEVNDFSSKWLSTQRAPTFERGPRL
jgi:hypothetical protein